MSQKFVYKVLKEMSGKATSVELKNYIRNKHPQKSNIAVYASNRLNSLVEKGILVRHDNVYEIIEEEPSWNYKYDRTYFGKKEK